MKTIQQIRLANLKALVAQYGGVTKFAVKVDKAQSMVSQWLNESLDHKSKKPRKITDFVARHVETKLAMEQGWMDHDHSSLASQLAVVISSAGKTKATDDYIEKNLPDWVRPDSALGMKLRRDTIVKQVAEAGKQRDLFRNRPKAKNNR